MGSLLLWTWCLLLGWSRPTCRLSFSLKSFSTPVRSSLCPGINKTLLLKSSVMLPKLSSQKYEERQGRCCLLLPSREIVEAVRLDWHALRKVQRLHSTRYWTSKKETIYSRFWRYASEIYRPGLTVLGGYFEMLESGRQDKLEESSFQVSLKSHDQDLVFCTSLLSLLLFKLAM